MVKDIVLMAMLPIRWLKTPLWLSETPFWRLEIALTIGARDFTLANGASNLVSGYSALRSVLVV